MPLKTNAIALNAGINTLAGAAGGTVTLNADTAALTIAAAGDIASDGLVSLTGATGISTAGDVSTTNDNVTYSSATTLTGNVLVDTGAGAGNITFSSTLDGTAANTQTLGLTAGTGNVSFANTVGATQALGAVTITSAADVGLTNTFKAASLTQTAGTGTSTSNVRSVVSCHASHGPRTRTDAIQGAPPAVRIASAKPPQPSRTCCVSLRKSQP